MVVAAQLRRSSNSVPFLIPISDPPTPKSFTCHTFGKSPVSPSIATLPKTRVSKLSICHKYGTFRGALNSPALRLSNAYSSSGRGYGTRKRLSFPESPVTKSPVVHPLSVQPLTKCSLHNSFVFNTIHFHGGGVPLLSSSKSIICASAASPPSRASGKNSE